MKNAMYLLVVLSLGLWSCGEDSPIPPRTYYEDVDKVVIQDFNINSVKQTNSAIFDKNKKIAVMEFKSPDNSQGGALVSDIFSLMLQQKGFKVVERDNIDKLLNEQKLMTQGKTNLSDLEIANKLGNLIAADYMVFGSVTLYKADGQTIYIPIRIVDEDKQEYQKDYEEYKDEILDDWFPLGEDDEERIKKMRGEGVLSLEEYEEEIKKVHKMEFRVIASIGISAKIVDVKTAKILWMGQAETQDFTLVNATNRILEKFINSIQKTN